MLKLVDGEAIGTRSPGVARAADCRDHGLLREGVSVGVQGVKFVKPTLDPAGFGVGGVMDYRGELMVGGGFEIPGEGLGFESYGLVGG